MKRAKPLYSLIVLFLLTGLSFGQLKSPAEFLGFKLGTDRKLADMEQIVQYFRMLDKNSDRIKVQEVGKTTLGNPFITAFITSAGNHQNLENYRLIQQKLADPRSLTEAEAEKLITSGKAVVMINCSIHATEIGASQMSLRLAYDLATGSDPQTRNILDNVILVLVPMHNPDGIKMVVDWYKKYLGTKYEGGRMPWLYNKYVGHDNNRDWFMFTQVETRLTIKVHNAWHPQIIVDMHQMGSTGARLFVPPFVDPFEPNVDPILIQQIAALGTFMASHLTGEQKAGVWYSNRYDGWTPARAYHHYHGGIRILTEAASAKVATPIEVDFARLSPAVKNPSVRMPLPWKGGRWSLGDIVEYDYSAAQAVLIHAAGLREHWIRNYHRVFNNVVKPKESPYAYIIPEAQGDPATMIKMLNILQLGCVEIHQASQTFTADGHEYPSGSFVIYLAQPFGGFAKAMLEKQVYPEIREYPGAPLKTPYDVVGHTLPLLMGVDAVKVDKKFEVKTDKVHKAAKPAGRINVKENVYGYAWGHSSNDDITALNRLTGKGYSVIWAAEEFRQNDRTFVQGTHIVTGGSDLLAELKSIAVDLTVNFQALVQKPLLKAYILKAPRLGLYKSWTAAMDEGWTRFVLEQFEFPYTSVYDQDIRNGDLADKYDVIIFPDLSNQAIVAGNSEEMFPPEYCGGIGDVGIRNIDEFVKHGGTLITLNAAAEFGMNSLHLGINNKVADISRKDFFIPGSLLQIINDTSHPIAFGYERDAVLFFRRSPVFSLQEGCSVVQYPARSLLSGWVSGEELLAGNSAIADIPYGRGKVILIGFPALYRSQSHGTFRYLFNSIYYGTAVLEKN